LDALERLDRRLKKKKKRDDCPVQTAAAQGLREANPNIPKSERLDAPQEKGRRGPKTTPLTSVLRKRKKNSQEIKKQSPQKQRDS